MSANTADRRACAQSDVWEPAPLPYVRASEHLPEPLPTPEEIRASKAFLGHRTGQTIMAVTPRIVVKFGCGTPEREGQTLLFLERHAPHVPAPRLYALYRDGEEVFIVMERFPGLTLERIWSDMSEPEKASVTSKLRAVFDDLRGIACPSPSHYGAVDGGPVPHHLFYSSNNDRTISGPFQDEAQFNMGLVTRYKWIQELNRKQDFKSDFYAKHLNTALRDHRPTLTHSDVQRKNIIVTNPNQMDHEKPRDFDIALVDWEDAGWYPDYWEYFGAFTGFYWDDDWCQRVEDFVTAWPAETAVMKLIYTDLFF